MRPALLAAALATVLGAARAEAAACCLSSSAFGLGRLASWEQAAVIVGGSVSPVSGSWDDQGAWHANPADYSENEWRTQLSALVALHERLQLSGRLPWVLTQKAAGPLNESGHGLGDSQLALRYEPVYQGEYDYLPELALNLGATVPTGRAMTGAQTILGSDVTGRGAWMLSASLTAELARAFWFVQLGGGLTYALPMAGDAPGETQQFGPGVQATLAGGIELTRGLVASLVARYSWEAEVRVNGQPVARSRAFDFGGGPALAWQFIPQLTLQAGLDLGLFTAHTGENRQGRTAGNLAFRYAYF